MSLKGMYKKEVVTCSRDTLISEAAQMMKNNAVGDVVVIEESNGMRKPIGMITDRDIVLGAVCDHPDDIKTMTVDQLMSPDLVMIKDDSSLFFAIRQMREGGVSRAPVVSEDGELQGILSTSRIFRVLNEEMAELAEITTGRKEFPDQDVTQRNRSQTMNRNQMDNRLQ